MTLNKLHLPAAAAAFAAVLLAACASTPEAGLRVSDRERIQATPLTEVPKTHKGPRYDKPKEAHEYYVKQRVRPGQTIPNERYEQARRQMARMPHFQFGRDERAPRDGLAPSTTITPMSAWTYLGPNNAGGRSRAVAIQPGNPNVMLASGVSGGIFRSTNAGLTWTPMDDAMQNMAVVAIEFAPGNPNIVYAGTGEGYFNADAVRGDGVFKSTDGGLTWTKLESTNRSGTNIWSYVYALRVDPANSNNVFAATWGGVLRSTNGGDSWSTVLNRNYCLDLEFNWDANVAIASCGTLDLPGQVFRSTNRGVNWGGTPVLAEANQSRTELAVSKSNPAVMYAAAAFYEADNDENYKFRGLWRSTDSGATWTLRSSHVDGNPFNAALLGDFDSACDGDPRAQGWYDLEVAVDPADPNIVWVGGIDIFRSNDGGANFGRAGVWYEDGNKPYGIHADQHRIIFHPGFNGSTNQIMFVGNDGGIYRTDNSRASVTGLPSSNCSTQTNPAVIWNELNDGFGVTQFYHGAVHPDADTNELLFVGGTQDNGTWFGDSDPNSWVEIFGGDGGYAAVDSDDGWDRFYTSYQNGNFIRWVWSPAQNRYVLSEGTAGINDDSLAFITPFAMDPNNPKTLWTGGDTMWRTTNAMGGWTQASAADVATEVSAVAVAPGNSNLVLAGTDEGKILRNQSALSANSGSAWESVTLASGGVISEITFDPNTPGRVYATQSRFFLPHVYRSDNNGATWTAIDKLNQAGGIPDIPVHTLVVDPDDSERLYVGTDLGLFVTTNGGGTWAVADSPLPNTVVEKLSFIRHEGQRKLAAFTHGRGAWLANAGTVVTTQRFNDVPQSFWAYQQIEQIAAAGITTGCSVSPPLYCPNDSVTRGQMAVFLLRSKNGSAYVPPPATGIFTDVALGLYYAPWVEQLLSLGITSGCSASPLKYCAEDPVTRGQMAVFLLRTKYGAAYTPPPATGLFSDVNLGIYYAPWIEQLYNEGITSGCGTSPLRFCPEQPVLRDQMAVFLVRTFDP